MNSEIQYITEDVVNKLVDLLGNKINRIILFGSYARGDFSIESDIDIMVLLDCNIDEVATYKKAVIHLASEASIEHEKLLSVILKDKDSFDRKKDIYAFYKNVAKEGVLLYG